ncbi:uncharacterized protein METZ01_LOCUS39179 [marine metagenome]|uniref:Uncharacterized protein n=1 Tax=marine metagenome TaxID=408172 RepID=A0A381R3K7_9ZZZZ
MNTTIRSTSFMQGIPHAEVAELADAPA